MKVAADDLLQSFPSRAGPPAGAPRGAVSNRILWLPPNGQSFGELLMIKPRYSGWKAKTEPSAEGSIPPGGRAGPPEGATRDNGCDLTGTGRGNGSVSVAGWAQPDGLCVGPQRRE
jgi:hypothetical protein